MTGNAACHALTSLPRRSSVQPFIAVNRGCFRANRSTECQAWSRDGQAGKVPLHDRALQGAGHAAAAIALSLLATVGGMALSRIEQPCGSI